MGEYQRKIENKNMKCHPQTLSQKDSRWEIRGISTHVLFRLFIVMLVFAVLLPESPLFKTYLGRDSGVFHYIGWTITQGQIPYRDVWDHKPPVIFFINALGLLLTDRSRWGVWGLEAIFLVSSGMISFSVLKKYFGLFPGFLATLAWLFSLPYLITGGNFPTEYSLLFQFLFMGIFSGGVFKEKAGRYWFVLGVLSGFLFLSKQNLIGISLAAVAAAIVMGIRDHKQAKMFSDLVQFTLGGVVVIAIFVVYFGLNHALKDFWDAAFFYNFAYSSVDNTSRLSSLAMGLRFMKTGGLSYLALMGFLTAVLSGIVPKISRKPVQKMIEPSPLLLLCLLDFPLELVMVSLSGRAYGHYFMSVLPIFAFFAAVMFHVILAILESVFSHRAVGVLFCCAVMGMFAVSQAPYRDSFFPFCELKTSAQIQDAVQYIQRNSSPEDKVLVLGAETSLNFLSQRVSPTRYVYQYPLIQKGYGTQRLQERFLNEVVANKPAVIVNAVKTNPIFMGFEPGYWDGKVFAAEFLSSESIQSSCQFQETIMNWDVYRCDWKD